MRFSHGGANEGFRASWLGYRQSGSGVVVMTNSDAGAALAADIVRTVGREYGFPGLAPVERTLGTADPATYEAFAGTYDLPGRTPPFIEVIAEDGRLFLGTGPRVDQRTELLPESADTFFATDRDVRLQFVRGAGARVTGIRVWQGARESRAARR